MINGRSPGRLISEEVAVTFGGVRALDGVDLELAQGEILGLIGPNGSGKTTMLNVLSGFLKPKSGSVRLGNRDITPKPAHEFSRHGIGRTFQDVRMFKTLPARDNIVAGALNGGASRREAGKRADTILKEMKLLPWAQTTAGALPYGQQRLLALARTLATGPTYLLLDEPAAGLNEAESDELVSVVRSVRDRIGCGVLIVEHDMRLIMSLCERIQVLDSGKTIAVGSPETVRADKAVITAYLGTGREQRTRKPRSPRPRSEDTDGGVPS